MRLPGFIAAGVLLAAACARAQTATDVHEPVSTAGTEPVLSQQAIEKAWTFSASAYTYIVPDGRDYVQPTFTADRDWLHLELRYNYEALETGSAWIGCNFGGGEDLTWEFTPMIGGVFGDTNGVAPGYKLTLGWWKIELYTEGEFVFDIDESSDSFFYSWSELTLAPVEWFRFGLAAQRTRVDDADHDVQLGVLAGFSFEHVDLSAYVFNLDEDTPTFVFSVGLTF